MTTKIFCALSNSGNLTGFHVDFDVSLSVGDLKNAIHKMKGIAGSAELTLIRICKGDVGGLTKAELERSLDLFKSDAYPKSREGTDGASLMRHGVTFKIMNLMEQVSLYTASLPANLYHVLVLVGMTMNCANCLTASSSLRNCAKCHRASYCNKQCQGQHWGVHRHICKKGYKIVTTASQGKVLQSTGDFQPGNVIFQEKPLVLFTDNNQLLVQVLKSEDLYNELLQLFCPSKESFDIIHNQEFFKHIKAHPFFRILSMDAFKYRMWIPNSEVDETIQKLPETLRNKKDPSLIRQILLIERFNTIGLTSQKDGLFKVACRAEHSCSPNVHFMWDGSSLKCVALESIRQGQNLTYSYLPGEILERSKSKRQQHLVKYLFLCHCARCEKESF